MPRFLPIGKEAKGAAGFLLAALASIGCPAHRTCDQRGPHRQNGAEPSARELRRIRVRRAGRLPRVRSPRTGCRRARTRSAASSSRASSCSAPRSCSASTPVSRPGATGRSRVSRLSRSRARSSRSRSTGSACAPATTSSSRSSSCFRAPASSTRELEAGPRSTPLRSGPTATASHHNVNLTLPPGDFDDVGARAWVGDEPSPCYTRGNTTGCVRVHLAAATGAAAALGRRGRPSSGRRASLVRLKARNLPQRPARSMTLAGVRHRRGPAATKPRRVVARSRTRREFDRSLAVVVGRAYSDVCVVASISSRDPECPHRSRTALCGRSSQCPRPSRRPSFE